MPDESIGKHGRITALAAAAETGTCAPIVYIRTYSIKSISANSRDGCVISAIEFLALRRNRSDRDCCGSAAADAARRPAAFGRDSSAEEMSERGRRGDPCLHGRRDRVELRNAGVDRRAKPCDQGFDDSQDSPF
jgi:hypothetical protein